MTITKFDFQQKAFHPDHLNNAYALAKLSKLIYQTPKAVQTKLMEEWAAQDAYCEDCPNNMQFALARFSGGLILVFKGTKESADWLVNFNVEKIDGPWNSRVHKGFYTALLQVWPQITENLQKMQSSQTQPLWITGHSLGGALATLAVAQFTIENRNVEAAYTFGCPRVGNKVFCDAYDTYVPHTVRFVNNEDIVPRIPKFAYDHVGMKCYFDRDRKMLWNPTKMQTWIDWMEEIDFRSSKITRNDLQRNSGAVGDHDMNKYIRGIENNMKVDGKPEKAHSAFLNYVNQK